MEIPVGKTYIAHAVMAAVALTICALLLSMQLGWIGLGSVQAAEMLVAIFGAIPAGLFAVYSAIAVIVALLRRQRVPRDVILLPAGLIVSLAWGSVVAAFGTPLLELRRVSAAGRLRDHGGRPRREVSLGRSPTRRDLRARDSRRPPWTDVALVQVRHGWPL